MVKNHTLILIIMTLLLATAAYRRGMIWRSDFILWNDAVKKSGAKARPHYNLGAAYHDEKGLLPEAIKNYEKALTIHPYYPSIYNDLGDALRDSGMLQRAIASYKTALYLKPFYPKAHNNLGVAYHKNRLLGKAVEEFKIAIKQMPDYPEPYYNLAVTLTDMSRRDEAVSCYKRFIEIAPDGYDEMKGQAMLNLRRLE